MLFPSAWSNPHGCPPRLVSDRVVSISQSQPVPREWVGGNLNTNIPSGLWARCPGSSHAEEFVPQPILPQHLGRGERMLNQPTSAICHDLQQATGTNPGWMTQDRSSLMEFPHFRKMVLKYNAEVNAQNTSHVGSNTSATGAGVDSGKGQNTLLKSMVEESSRGEELADSRDPTPKRLGKRHRSLALSGRPQNVPDPVKVHIESASCENSTTSHYGCHLPEKLTTQLPNLVRPSNPEKLRSTLQLLKPTIVYAEYECEDMCRSRGICVHFSLILGGRKTPDGLICQTCQEQGVDKAVNAARICPRHNSKNLTSFMPNLPEDILATDAQSTRAHEILTRSLNYDWDGIPGKADRRRRTSTLSQSDNEMRLPKTEGQETERDTALQSVEMVQEEQKPVVKRLKANENDFGFKPDQYPGVEKVKGSDDLTKTHQGTNCDGMFSADLESFMAVTDGGLGSCDLTFLNNNLGGSEVDFCQFKGYPTADGERLWY